MFEIPNESRMPYEHYYDEEDFADENFMDEENLNVEFADPYEGYPVWNGPSDFNENNRMGPNPFQCFSMTGTVESWSPTINRLNVHDGVEALAGTHERFRVGLGYLSAKVRHILQNIDLETWRAAEALILVQ